MNDSFLTLYRGFSIKVPVGNNAFSYQSRKNKSIFVPPIVGGSLTDLKTGTKTAFCEIEDGIEKSFPGLEKFIHWIWRGKDIFIFDNHNHAFFFWAWALTNRKIMFDERLVHIDQHTDMRRPEKWISTEDFTNPQNVFQYTNYDLNVGNFIQPALKMGLFQAVEVIDSSYGLEKEPHGDCVFDLDIDFFSPEMEYIPYDRKISKIRDYLLNAKFITIATSPFFMDQQKAIDVIRNIFEGIKIK